MGFDNNIILKNLKGFNLIVASKASKAKLEEINLLKLEANEEEKENEEEKKSRICHMVLK